MILHALQFETNSSQMDFHSIKTALIPFVSPCNSGSSWLSGKHICYTCLCVSSLLGAGSGLFSGMTVSHSFLCFPPGWIFMELTLRVSSAKPPCAEDQSNTKTPMQLGWVYPKIDIVSLTCSISCSRSHHELNPFPRYIIFQASNAQRRSSDGSLS